MCLSQPPKADTDHILQTCCMTWEGRQEDTTKDFPSSQTWILTTPWCLFNLSSRLSPTSWSDSSKLLALSWLKKWFEYLETGMEWFGKMLESTHSINILARKQSRFLLCHSPWKSCLCQRWLVKGYGHILMKCSELLDFGDHYCDPGMFCTVKFITLGNWDQCPHFSL